MPTGYTDRLEKMDWDLKRWLTESISRAFGMCIMLRDENNNMDVDQIRARLEKESQCSYYRDRVKENREELAESEALSLDEWQKQIDGANKRIVADFETAKIKQTGKVKQYRQTLGTLKLWFTKTDDENFSNFFRYAIEQLEMVANEFEMPSADSYRLYKGTSQEYADEQIKLCRDTLEWNERHLAKEETRQNEGLDLFTSWVKFVETL